MDIQCSEEEIDLLKRIGKAGDRLQMPVFVIGGFVRDKLLDRETKDADIVSLGDGIALAKEAANYFSPVPEVHFFKNFGTAQIKIYSRREGSFADNIELPPPFEVEFVGARKESYRYHSRKPEVEPGTLEEDRLRRDFTINTMAISLNKENFGVLIDPLGGKSDLEKKVLRTPLPPDQTFIDDPLRMMRAIRFATQLEFTIDPQTYEAIKRNAARIRIVSAERITDEINKIIMTLRPSGGFDLLLKTGLLPHIFPQMVALCGAEYIDGKGHKDNFYHTIQVLDNIAPYTEDLWLRWAAILHDIGKPATKRFEEGHGWTFHGHEVVGGRMVPKIFSQLKLPQNEKMRFVRKIVELHLRPISLTKENITDSAVRRLIVDAGEDLESLMTLCKADITSKNAQKVARFLANFEMVERRVKEVEASDHLRNWQPPITGEIIMEEFNLPPCRQVGEIKTAVREAILDGIIPNEYEAAYEYMQKIAAELGIQRKINS
ncbi:MAG: HD domain-containing protein [Bacteroidota bacterium]|nr:HD domain-containing protein [Bacteroidota bacterium]